MKKRFTSGFSLVELTLALGIAAFCLIAVFGLMPVGVQTNRNATSQTAATNIMAAVVADLRATPTFNTSSTEFGIIFGTNATLYFDGTGQFATSLGANSRYQLNVTWYGSAGLRYVISRLPGRQLLQRQTQAGPRKCLLPSTGIKLSC